MENIKLDSNVFNFQFFLSNSEIVETLEIGATKNGGATKFNNKIISNYEGSEFIEINNIKNELSVFIPSTTNVNEEIDNNLYVKNTVDKLANLYNINDLIFYKTYGSWFSEDNNNVVIEDITIVTLNLKEISEIDIRNFIEIAEYLKEIMTQEGVSISINNSLAII